MSHPQQQPQPQDELSQLDERPSLSYTNNNNTRRRSPTTTSTTRRMMMKNSSSYTMRRQQLQQQQQQENQRRFVWNVVVGICATLDFCAAMAKRHASTTTSSFTANARREGRITDKVDDVDDNGEDVLLQFILQIYHTLIHFLIQYADILGILFGIVWFIDAFVTAHEKRWEAAYQHDQKLLLQQYNQRHHWNPRKKNDSDDNDDDDKGEENNNETTKQVKELWWWSGFRGVYLRTMLFQILLLPLGFFTTVYQFTTYWSQHIVLALLRHSSTGIDKHHRHSTIFQPPPISSSSSSSFSWLSLYPPLPLQQRLPHNDDATLAILASSSSFSNNNNNSTMSLAFVLIQYVVIHMVQYTHQQVRYHTITNAKELGIQLFFRALRHPIQFNRRLRRFLSIARWIQYGMPLFGTFNKLKGNISNLYSKYQQRQQTRKVQEIVTQHFSPTKKDITTTTNETSPKMDDTTSSSSSNFPTTTTTAMLSTEKLREYCARLIQNCIRKHQARQQHRVLVLWHKEQRHIISTTQAEAIYTIQCAMRASLSRGRARYIHKCNTLAQLRQKELEFRQQSRLRHRHYHQRNTNTNRNRPTTKTTGSGKDNGNIDDDEASRSSMLTTEERRTMYRLQEELEQEAQSWINEKLLLRPNTAFAVYWKILFVFAVLIEISTLALQPILSQRYQDPVTHQPMDLESILDHHLIPTPVFKLPICTGRRRRNRHSRRHSFNARQPLRSIRRILFQRRQSTSPSWWWWWFHSHRKDREEQEASTDDSQQQHSEKHHRPWYCSGTYSRFQAVYIAFTNILIHHFFTVLSIICFIDVYVEFFTGEYDKVSGRLVPSPFFTRWIFPGLLLQLMVNPEMDTISTILSRTMAGLLFHGPIRVLRWTIALFYPLCIVLFQSIQWFWYHYASDQNLRHLVRRTSSPPPSLARSNHKYSNDAGRILSASTLPTVTTAAKNNVVVSSGWDTLSSMSPTTLRAQLELVPIDETAAATSDAY